MVREWIQNMVVYLLFMALIRQVIPNEGYGKYVKLTMGMIFIWVMISPITNFLNIDRTIEQAFFKNSLKVSAYDSQMTGQALEADHMWTESYRQLLMEEIEAYFERSGMKVFKCDIEINENIQSEDFGTIYGITVDLVSKDRMVQEIKVDPISVADKKNQNYENVYIPLEKMKEWKKDLSLQFGLKEELINLEIIA